MLKGEDCYTTVRRSYTTVRHSWPARTRILLLALVAAAAPVANAVAPVLTQDDLISTWVDDNATGFTWSLPASTTVTKHEYRYKVWNRSEVPTSWTQDWTDLLLADTRCNVITNPGTPSQTASAAQTGAACATKGSDATQSHRNWTTLGGLTNGARYTFELRAVNNDGNSDAITWNIALAADPDGVVTFSDAEFEGRVRTRAQAYFPSLGANDPITQLHMARLTWLHERGGTRAPDNRIRSLDGIEYAVNLESLFIDFHQVLEIQRLQGLYEMEVFSFSGGLLSDVSPLQNLLNLEELLLNRGRSYPPPGVCTGTASSPEHGDTAVWPPAADCPPAQVDDVVVKDLSSLRRLTKLWKLYVCDQRVDPRTLTALVNLEEMSYCRNDLRDISAMRGLTKMDKLYLFENRIEDVSPLAGMTELQFLQLHDNAIRDVSSLSGLTKLTSIYLSDNPLDAGACSTGGHATRAACTDASGTWTTSVVSTLTPLVTGSCSVAGQTTEADCTSNSGTWTAGTLKLIDLRGDTQLTDADVAALSGLTGVTVLHDSDIRPAAPASLSATTGTRTATLSWTDPSNAAIAAYQYRHRQGTGPWSDWTMTPEPESSFHYWNRGDPALASLTLSDLPGGANTVELRAVVASDYNNARNRNSDGTTFTAIKSHATAVTAAAVGAGRWDVGRVLTPGANTTVSVNAPVTASIASTAPTALAETNLDGARVTLELSGTTFGASLAASNFTLTTTPTIAGLSVASVSRSSDTRATLTLRFDDTNFDTQATLAVRVLAAALSSASDLDTQTVAVAPTLGLVFTGPTGIGMGMFGVDEDPGGANANVGAYNIALAGQPTGTVTVTPTISNSDVAFTGTTLPLTFDGTNWDTAQSVGVTASQDGDAIDDIAYIDHAVTGIPGLTAGGRLTLTVTDDETQGLTLAATTLTGSGVTEGGSAVTYTARLASAPTGPVRVQITGGAGAVSVDTAAAAGLQNTLLFNATNYSTPQTVTVTALADDDGESESVTLNHVIFGADYQDLDDVALAFTVTDNDTRGATLSTGGVSYVVQENGSRLYTLVLDTEPVNGNVSVAVASSDTAVVTAEPSTLTFTAQNWNVPQPITISGVDDANTTDDNASVTHTPSGADYGSGVTIPNLGVRVSDDDVAGLTVLPSALTVSEGGTGTYTVRLNAAPTATVTVTVAAASAEVTADTDTGTTGIQTTLSFDAANWNTAQTVTVTGAADDDGEDESVGISHSVTGTGNYASVPAFQRPGLVVQVRDDETAGVVVSPTSLTIDEGGTATYTVRLSAPPATGNATVTIAATGAVGVTVDTSTLTFSGTTWNTAQTVTATAVADHTRVSAGTATVTHTVTGYGTVTAGPALPVQVRNTTMDYDADADGLIEIANLAQLNAMRWDLDGDGTASSGDETEYAAAFPNPRGTTMSPPVCPTTITGVACTGYELAANLDFDTNGNGRTWTTSGGALTGDGDEYDNSGMGWEPIGTDAARFAAVFRGNGRTIDNLFVNRPGLVGLFGSTDTTARLESVGLRNARVAGSGVVGILAGEAHGDVVGCYATGTAGSPTTPTVGGLVGQLRGEITASYSAAAVDGSDQIGGLVGAVVGDFGQTRMVSASYAVGRTSALPEGLWAGGLMGRAFPVLPESAVSAPDSYYDRATTTRTQSARGEALTTAGLQSPTGYVGVYRNWNKDLDGDGQMDDPWNFGTSSQYPKLKWQGFDAERQRFPSPEEEQTTTPTSRVPTAVQARSTGQGLVVTWQAAIGATAYRVQWRQSGQEWSTARQAETTRTRYEIASLAEGSYEVRVLPVVNGQVGEPSATARGEVEASGNRPPRALGIADVELDVGETEEVDLDDAFEDRDGDALRYSAAVDGNAVEASVSGATLRLRGRRAGEATVTVTATDPGGLSASASFTAQVGAVVSLHGRPAAPEGDAVTLRAELSRPLASDVEVPWRMAPDGDPTTADADAADFGAWAGTATFAAGETRAVIAVAVLDDDDIEPARERFAVELAEPEDGSVGLSARSWRMVGSIQEGVCDRTPEVRAELSRGWRDCRWPRPADLSRRATLDLRGDGAEALHPDDLLGLSGLRTLDLGRNALRELPAALLSHAPRLRSLRLDGNRLQSLPAGLLAGTAGLRELRLAGNPGAPFALAPELRRTDAEPWAAGPATVEAALPLGAPFAMRLALTAVGGEASAEELALAAGAVASGTVRVSSDNPVRLSLAAPTIPETRCATGPCFDGLAAEGSALALFAAPPRIAGEITAAELLGAEDDARIDLSAHFAASAAGGALSYSATVDDALLATVSVAGAVLTVSANEDGEEGTATVTVVATDELGQTATLRFAVEVLPRPPGRWRGWRSTIAAPAAAAGQAGQ